eukprot:4101036-Ditylum_brightwellii.AAC.1
MSSFDDFTNADSNVSPTEVSDFPANIYGCERAWKIENRNEREVDISPNQQGQGHVLPQRSPLGDNEKAR